MTQLSLILYFVLPLMYILTSYFFSCRYINLSEHAIDYSVRVVNMKIYYSHYFFSFFLCIGLVLSLRIACMHQVVLRSEQFFRYIPIACRVYKNDRDSTTNEYESITILFSLCIDINRIILAT
jgi:glucose-6-phosphate-specific signal transduction histidine kinase